VVCPILYHAPVVQNLGLFLRGIDKPLPPPQTDHDKYPVPSHKAALLDLTTSLHVVHASSRNPLLKPYLESKMRFSRPEKNIVRSSRADRLGRVDLAGWRMTRRLLDVTEPKRLSVSSGTLFKNIKAFSFGHGMTDAGKRTRSNMEKDPITSSIARFIPSPTSRHSWPIYYAAFKCRSRSTSV